MLQKNLLPKQTQINFRSHFLTSYFVNVGVFLRLLRGPTDSDQFFPNIPILALNPGKTFTAQFSCWILSCVLPQVQAQFATCIPTRDDFSTVLAELEAVYHYRSRVNGQWIKVVEPE